jgi:spermidine synthase
MFNITLEKEINHGMVRVFQDGDNVKMTIGEDRYSLIDSMNYIKYYCKRLDTFKFNSILIGGLGIGNVPFYLENYKSKTNIDVVEYNQYVIEAVKELNHLKHTNIINNNFFLHKTDKKYDLILIDLWWNDFLKDWGKTEDFFIKKVKTKFKNNLNKNGKIYVPIIDLIIDLES